MYAGITRQRASRFFGPFWSLGPIGSLDNNHFVITAVPVIGVAITAVDAHCPVYANIVGIACATTAI